MRAAPAEEAVRTDDIIAAVEQIRPLLAGHASEVQGAVLADCLAMWLAGHHVEGDGEATRKLRAELLAMHCFEVGKLMTINARIMGTTP